MARSSDRSAYRCSSEAAADRAGCGITIAISIRLIRTRIAVRIIARSVVRVGVVGPIRVTVGSVGGIGVRIAVAISIIRRVASVVAAKIGEADVEPSPTAAVPVVMTAMPAAPAPVPMASSTTAVPAAAATPVPAASAATAVPAATAASAVVLRITACRNTDE
jgi:hypothetical protein